MNQDLKSVYELCLSTYGVRKINVRELVDWYKRNIPFWLNRSYVVFLDRYQL